MGRDRTSRGHATRRDHPSRASELPTTPATAEAAGPTHGHNIAAVDIVATRVQAKLEISEPNDPAEHEADRAARTIAESADGVVPRLQRAPTHAGTPVPPTSDVVAITEAPGSSLPPDVRGFMEPRFGFDFGRVRVHTDARADAAARSINARAYTLNDSIVFGAGTYAPETREGRRLLAHELAHVVQQQESSVQRSIVQRDPAPAAAPAAAPVPSPDASPAAATASQTSVKVQVTTGPDPEYTSNSRNTGSGLIVFSANAEETYESLRALGRADMWNMACVVGNLAKWAASTSDPSPQASPGGISATNPNPADTTWEESYRATFPHFRKHIQAFYSSFTSFQEDFKKRGTETTLGLVAESKARTEKTIKELGISPKTESERGPMGAEYTTTYTSDSEKTKQLSETATKLLAKQEALEKLVKQDDDRTGTVHQIFTSTEDLNKEDKELREKIPVARKAWEDERREAFGKFPVLSRFESTAQLKALTTNAGAAHYVGTQLSETLGNIKELEDSLKISNSRILQLPDLCDRLKDALNLTEFQRHTVNYMRQKHTGDLETGQRALVLIAVVLAAIAAAPATGGASLVVGLAALGEAGVNTILLLQAYDQYSLEKAAAGSDEDKAKALSSDDPSFWWLAFQVVTTLMGIKGSLKTGGNALMKELKGAFEEVKTGYKVAATTGETSQLKNALKNQGFSEAASQSLLAKVAQEATALIEGIARNGPEGIASALELLKTSPNFYGVRMAVWRLKAGANGPLVQQNLQTARQQAVNKIVDEFKKKYPKATFAVIEQGFEKPMVVKIGSAETPPPSSAPGSTSTPPSSAPPSGPPSSAPPTLKPDGGSAATTAPYDELPAEVKGKPTVTLPKDLFVQTSKPGAAAVTGEAASVVAPPAAPMGAPAAVNPLAGSVPVAPGAGSVPPPAGWRPPMAPPEAPAGIRQANEAASELAGAGQNAFGGASAVAGGDLAVQMDIGAAPFGPLNDQVNTFYAINPRLPKPEYNGLYVTLPKRFEIHEEMTRKFATKGSSGKIILKDNTSKADNPTLFMFKPGGDEALLSAVYQVQPGTYFIRGRVAYEIALDLPTVSKDMVPMGVAIYQGRVGSLQPMMKNTENLLDLMEGKPLNPSLTPDAAKQMYKEITEVNAEFKRLKSNIQAYDHIINNPDRNMGNFMVELNDDLSIKRFYAIDQDLAFQPGARNVVLREREAIPLGAPAAGQQIGQQQGVPQATIGKISKSMYDELLMMKVNEHSVRESLEKIYGLDKGKIDGVFQRLDEFLRDFNLRLKDPGGAEAAFLD